MLGRLLWSILKTPICIWSDSGFIVYVLFVFQLFFFYSCNCHFTFLLCWLRCLLPSLRVILSLLRRRWLYSQNTSSNCPASHGELIWCSCIFHNWRLADLFTASWRSCMPGTSWTRPALPMKSYLTYFWFRKLHWRPGARHCHMPPKGKGKASVKNCTTPHSASPKPELGTSFKSQKQPDSSSALTLHFCLHFL